MHVFGVVNATPDSFSDGGRHNEVPEAVDHALRLVRHGADVIDVGGESTRPGAVPIGPNEEQRRVMPIIERLVAHNIPVSIDTMHSQTAGAALRAGARFVNDVSGGQADPLMIPTVIDADVDYIAMHWGGGANATPPSGSATGGVIASLRSTVRYLVSAGMRAERIIVDPGLGFGKSNQQNWELIGSLKSLCEIGPRVLVGHSRKRFIGSLLPNGTQPADRDVASAGISILCAAAGVWGVRVHDPEVTRRVLAATGIVMFDG
ncbi:dihydropteroate synthase [Rathayibacter soli]|uniref:dihydropteroate synthase n=1 Tax=Rathayibacter soli TaxID=3144168 RepID=UPI0027E3BA9A|nr:dihydropteroate synthase [Glaciibacter superstes]